VKGKGKSKGFKQVACQSKTCFRYSIEPPTLSDKVIRSLGKDFCKMPHSVVSDVFLRKKPLAKKGCKTIKESKEEGKQATKEEQ
jgi:hypothetical protein